MYTKIIGKALFIVATYIPTQEGCYVELYVCSVNILT